MLGHPEIIVIAAVVLVLFGSAAIPKFFRAIGKARKEFEKGAKDAELADADLDQKDVAAQNPKK